MMHAVAESHPAAPEVLEADAFGDRLEPLLERAYRLAYLLLSDREAAQDAVQEAAVRAWRKQRQRRGELRPWFLAIVANECRRVRRLRWWSVVRLPEILQPSSVQPELDASDLRAAVRRLPARDRSALFLHFYLDLPLEEVGRVLGLSAAGAKTRVYRAARRLRPELREEDLR